MPKRTPEKSKKQRQTPEKSSAAKLKKDRRRNNVLLSHRWYKYQKSWLNKQTVLKNQRAEAKKQGTFFLEPEAKVALVIRVRGKLKFFILQY